MRDKIVLFLNLVPLQYENKTHKIQLPKGRILKTLQTSVELFAENLFAEVKLINGTLSFSYQYKKGKQGDKWFHETMIIMLTKCGS